MFERDIRDASFVKRWSIVRTIRDQSVAEHSYFVTMYANDICVYLGLSPTITLAALQYSLWHDTRDEIFTGDFPGPNKRAMLSAPGAREAWDAKLKSWSNIVFERLSERSGGMLPPEDAATVKLVVKLADWMDAAMEMATEAQLGNHNTRQHMNSQMRKAIEACDQLCNWLMETLVIEDDTGINDKLGKLISDAIIQSYNGDSQGPHVASASL